MNKSTNYINHIAFCIDKSGSIRNAGLEKSIISVFDGQIKKLKSRSEELGQETRVSLYLFNDNVECVCFDININNVPSLQSIYRAHGDTALLDCAFQCIDDLKSINNKYGDNSYLCFFISDGENNINNNLSTKLGMVLRDLPENWTIAALAPDFSAVQEYKKLGFSSGNIQIWDVSNRGLREVGDTIYNSTTNYLMARSSGQVGTKALFTLNADKLDKTVVKRNLEELPVRNYRLLNVNRDIPIKDFVESWTKESYRQGSGFYELTKPETIQPNKNICVQDRLNGRIYTGAQVRKLLDLPNFTVKVNPVTYNSKYDLFVQSNSTNRRLVAGTKLLLID